MAYTLIHYTALSVRASLDSLEMESLAKRFSNVTTALWSFYYYDDVIEIDECELGLDIL